MVKYREHILLLVILCIIVHVKRKKQNRANFIKYNKRDKTIIAHHSDPFLAVHFQTSKKKAQFHMQISEII